MGFSFVLLYRKINILFSGFNMVLLKEICKYRVEGKIVTYVNLITKDELKKYADRRNYER